MICEVLIKFIRLEGLQLLQVRRASGLLQKAEFYPQLTFQLPLHPLYIARHSDSTALNLVRWRLGCFVLFFVFSPRDELGAAKDHQSLAIPVVRIETRKSLSVAFGNHNSLAGTMGTEFSQNSLWAAELRSILLYQNHFLNLIKCSYHFGKARVCGK